LPFLFLHGHAATAYPCHHPIQFNVEPLDLLGLPLLSWLSAGLLGLRLHALHLPIFGTGQRLAHWAH
jgi:hypothetical protein